MKKTITTIIGMLIISTSLFSQTITFYYDLKGNQTEVLVENTMPQLEMADGTIYTSQPDTVILAPGSDFESYLWQDNSTNPTFNVADFGEYSVELTFGECSQTVNYTVASDQWFNTYNITKELATNGEIHLSATEVYHGGYVWVNTIAEEGYEVDEIFVNGVSQGSGSSLMIPNITENKIVEVLFSEVLSITNNTLNDLIIYPNPVQNIITLDGWNNYPLTIELIDISGKIILRKEILSNELDLSNIKTGIYILKVKNNAGIETYKIMKE